MNKLTIRNKIGQIAKETSRFFIGTTNAPKPDCINVLTSFNFSKMEIITMTKRTTEIQELHEIMLEVFKRKGNYDKQFITNNKIEGDTKWHKLFVAY